MLLHIGNGKTVRTQEIVGIFDLDNATLSQGSRAYLSHATREGEVSYADSDIPRAFLVVSEKREKAKKINKKEKTVLLDRPSPATHGEENPRRRHPARRGGKKKEPPAQTVLLSHISSAALHARCERPLFEEE